MYKNSPLISVIINCHNGEKYLEKSVRSVIRQTYKNWEIIFWDNRSTDNSKKIIKSFNDKRIKYFKSKKYSTLYKARNIAIKKAKGKYIAFLDTDDWWHKTKLEEQIKFLKKNKKYQIICTNFYFYFQNINKFKKRYSNLPSGPITQKLLNNYSVGISTVLLEKKFFKKFVFNEKYNVVVLDEAQNATSGQMMMFLTRLGEDSKMVVTGDVTQIDLPSKTLSGLKHVVKVLADVKGISFTHFGAKDVVRHPLVQRIVEAYGRQDAND